MPRLRNLLRGIEANTQLSLDTEITGIVYDSRRIEPGNIFIAYKGTKDHGKNYIAQAKEKGAIAVATEEKLVADLPLILVSDVRLAGARLAVNFYQDPSNDFFLIGVTGTNGKTTITYFLESIFASAGQKPGVIGTINYRLGKDVFSLGLTTPEAIDLQRIFSWMKTEGAKSVIMEVSSHALAQSRVSGCHFDLAIFTNLTPEHLDFHETMDNYFLAKTKLFTGMENGSKRKSSKFAIINFDCPWGRKLAKMVKVPVVTYGIKEKSDFQASEIKLEEKGISFRLRTHKDELPVYLSFLGRHNILNALAAIAAASAAGIGLETIIKGLEEVKSIPGRLESINQGQPFNVTIDYAHTPDALENVLLTLCEICTGRIITVFGCGGDRDNAKRPLMGEVASRLSHFVLITTDNPRSEDPGNIARDIEKGIKSRGRDNYRIILDRREAIAEALSGAREGDLVLIAGKGHENYQIFVDRTVPFSDREVVIKLLEELSFGEGSNC